MYTTEGNFLPFLIAAAPAVELICWFSSSMSSPSASGKDSYSIYTLDSLLDLFLGFMIVFEMDLRIYLLLLEESALRVMFSS